MWTSNINQAKEKGGLENVDVWETATVGIATATGTTATIATGGAMTAVAPAAVSTLGGMVTIGATSSLAGGIATRASYNCAYNLNLPMSDQLGYVLDPKAQAYDMAVGGLSGAAGYGISNYSPKSALSSAKNFFYKYPPKNPGQAFQSGQRIGSIQQGVNPNTLTPAKDLSKLDPKRVANAVKYAGDNAIQVSQSGIIQNGHHRVLYAINRGNMVDVEIVTGK